MITATKAESRLFELFDRALDLTSQARDSLLASLQDSEPDTAVALARLLERHDNGAGLSTKLAVDQIGDAADTLSSGCSLDGLRVGAYEIVDEIGRGGMGRVFRARRVDGAVEQIAAIKLVRREMVSKALLKRFSHERNVLAALDHPGICRLFDAGETPDGTPYLVMELIEGLPLSAYCDAHTLSVRARVQLFRYVLSAVSYAHRKLVIHRDLKPSNVLVGADGRPKLVDFGIAKSLVDSCEDHTATADRLLTPAFAAPEQLRGETLSVACDVYALGALLYQLLTSRQPIETENRSATEVERDILERPPVRPSQVIVGSEAARLRACDSPRELARQLSGDLELVVLRCLRNAPGERYSSVEQLDDDLERWLNDRPISLRKSELAYRAGKFVRRHRTGLALASLAGAAVIGTTITIATQAVALRAERDRANAERDTAQSVVQLMKRTIAGADPSGTLGADVTAREILHVAGQELGAVRATQPRVYFDLALAIADVQLALGLANESLALVAQLESIVDGGASDAVERDALLLTKGRALVVAGRYQEAEQALSLVDSAGGDQQIARLLALATTKIQTGRWSEAIVELEDLVDSIAQRPAPDALAMEVRWQLANGYRFAGRYSQALEAANDQLAWQRKTLAENHPAVLRARMLRSVMLRRAGQKSQALLEIERVVPALELVYGKDSPVVATAMMTWGAALGESGRERDAIEPFVRAREIFLARAGQDHPNTTRATYNLAVQLVEGAPSDSRIDALFRSAISSAESQWQGDNENHIVFRTTYAQYLASKGRVDEALIVMTDPVGAASLAARSRESSSARFLADLMERANCGTFGSSMRASRSDVVEAADAATRSANCVRARSVMGEWQWRSGHQTD